MDDAPYHVPTPGGPASLGMGRPSSASGRRTRGVCEMSPTGPVRDQATSAGDARGRSARWVVREPLIVTGAQARDGDRSLHFRKDVGA
jgi:hypothetical protein